MSDESKNLVKAEPRTLLKPVASLKEIQESQSELEVLITGGLEPGIDFGTIPGTDKPTLLKPGAEKILRWFNCYAEYNILSEEHDVDKINIYYDEPKHWDSIQKRYVKTGEKVEQRSSGYHNYKMQCHLISRATTEIIGTGVGSCSTAEKKYISRPNDVENTVLKIAKKRSLVDATLATFALSDRFTQDHGDKDKDEEKTKKTEMPKSKTGKDSGTKITREDATNMLVSMFTQDEAKAFLKEITAFTGNEGKEIPGVDSLDKMSDSRFYYASQAIKARFVKWEKEQGEKAGEKVNG